MTVRSRGETALVVAVAGAIVVGLACAGTAAMLAIGLGGGGHGWVTPFFASGVLAFAYPLVLIRAALGPSPSQVGRVADGAVLVAALLCDIGLVQASRDEGLRYARQALDGLGTVLFIPWLLLWLGWQVLAAGQLLRRGWASL